MSVSPAAFLNRRSPPHIATIILLAALPALTMNVFLPSLTSMAAHFETEYRVMQLSVSLFLVVNAGLQVFIGPISDRYGRRRVLLVTIALFVLATLGTIFAPTAEVFLSFRMAQAIVVSGMVLSRAVVRDIVGPDEAASMIGYVTMGMALVPMAAPVLGGALEQAFGWQSNFWLMFVAGVAVLALVWADLGETAVLRPMRLSDQLREYPDLLRAPRFWGYCLASAFASGAFFAYLGGAPFVGLVVFGLDPAQLGLYFGAPALGYGTGNFLSGRYSRHFGLNRMILAGTLTTLAGISVLVLIEAAGGTTAAIFFGLSATVGLGNGLVMPNATAGMLSVRPHMAGTASGLGGAIMIAGGAALSALAGGLLVPGSGAMPLLLIMLATTFGSVLSIVYVIRRDRSVGRV